MRPTWLTLSVVIAFCTGVAFAGAGSWFMHETNQQEFCVSCHSMTIVFEEYQQSQHFKNIHQV